VIFSWLDPPVPGVGRAHAAGAAQVRQQRREGGDFTIKHGGRGIG